jgi:hypothetical protein
VAGRPIRRRLGRWYHVESLLSQDIPAHIAEGHLPPAPLSTLGLAAGFIADLSVLLAVLLILSEAAVLICRAYPDIRSRLLSFFVRVHSCVRSIGSASIVLALLKPLLPMAYYYSHSHP